MGRGTKKFKSKFVKEREQKLKTVKVSQEQRVQNQKKQAQKTKRKEKQERLDIEFRRAGITKKDLKNSQMDKAEVKRLITRAVKNGAEASDVKDYIDFETTFENNVRKNPLFAGSLEDYRKPDFLTPGEKVWAEDYYLLQAEKNQKKAIRDSRHELKPVRSQITKAWIKSPFSKIGGDIESIDDGSNPFDESDFT